MNTLDTIQAQVMRAVNGPCQGRPGNYRVAGTVVDIPLNFIPNANRFQSVFDTGGSDVDFDIITGLFSASEVTATPLEQGRGTAGDTWVFSDTTAETWHVKQLAASAENVGSYYDVLMTNYSGPLKGV